MSELRRARALIAVALVAVALLLSGCGGDDEDATTSPAPAPAPALNGGATPPSGGATPNLSNFPPAFLECLADQGVDIESEPDVSAALHSPQGNRCFTVLHGG